MPWQRLSELWNKINRCEVLQLSEATVRPFEFTRVSDKRPLRSPHLMNHGSNLTKSFVLLGSVL